MLRVMLIDDEEDALDLLEILLGQIGNVSVIGRYINPKHAIDALKQTSENAIDAIFLDNQMPGMNGTEAARAIRKLRPEIPIVFTTAYAKYAVEAFEIQSTDYLLKPFTLERLFNAVARIKPYVSNEASHNYTTASAIPTVQCLGGFHIHLPGKDNKDKLLSWKTKKEKELCAFLLHHEGIPVNSAAIIEALWPEHDLDKAKTYLYTCTSYLRKSLADNHIPIRIHKADHGFVTELDGILVDVTEFERLLIHMLSGKQSNEQEYHKLIQLYSGEYMEGCDFKWAQVRQMKINTLYIRALRQWHDYFLQQGNMTLAVDSIQQLLTIKPDSEADGRKLISLYLETGNRNEALRIYLQLEHVVRAELGAELEEATLRLYWKVTSRKQGRVKINL